MKASNTGSCNYCKIELSKTEMKKHILTCTSDELTTNSDIYFLLVEGKYLPEYWLYLRAAAGALLEDLDSFLRNIWLECCGHLSCFHINDAIYASQPDNEFQAEKSMNFKMSSVLKKGDIFIHEYDYGSTTELKIKVLEIATSKRGKKKIGLIAQNLPLKATCSECKNEAEFVCCECSYEENKYLCDECGDNHECGEEMLLPITNSPRCGVCAYTG